jgi:nudix-type nucleoside diphosphatase (YffH/AdpP family)
MFKPDPSRRSDSPVIAKDSERIRIVEERVLSKDWYVLRKTTFDYQRRDGTWQRQSRETYDRGNGASILLYNRARRTVILTRQFRFPSYVNGQSDGMLIEACAGLLDRDDPIACIQRESEEETGYRVRQVFDTFMSPGSVTERLHLFVASYEARDKVSEGGGDEDEGEEIEVLELGFDEALAMMARGEIRDGKTIILLQHAALARLLD